MQSFAPRYLPFSPGRGRSGAILMVCPIFVTGRTGEESDPALYSRSHPKEITGARLHNQGPRGLPHHGIVKDKGRKLSACTHQVIFANVDARNQVAIAILRPYPRVLV